MKIAVSGKGGVGKTTATALLAYVYAGQGYQVLAVDADPSPCLGEALGFPPALLAELQPIADMEDLIAERTGTQPGGMGGYFRLNPRVEDIPERFSALHRGIRLLQLGAVEKGGSGCICPESVLLRSLVTHILLGRTDVVLLDMYAGVEHLGRATADAVDAMLVVVEPTARSIGTAAQIRTLAEDLHLPHLFLVGSKVTSAEDREFIESHSPGLEVLGHLPVDEGVREADRESAAVFDRSARLVEETKNIARALEKRLRG